MSSRRTRKRKRGDSVENSDPVAETHEPTAVQMEDVFADSLEEKDRIVWEDFREEYIESVEQLPLSLHRSFALLHELDSQATGCQSKLLPTLREYITRRYAIHEALAQRRIAQDPSVEPMNGSVVRAFSVKATSPVSQAVADTLKGESSMHDTPKSPPPSRHGSIGPPASLVDGSETAPPSQISSTAASLSSSLRTEEVLPRISSQLNEYLRASEEKLNLAQATYDSVDRHVRLLDQAIREQESRVPATVRTKVALVLLAGNEQHGAAKSANARLENPLQTLAAVAPEVASEENVTGTGTRSSARSKKGQRRMSSTARHKASVSDAGTANRRDGIERGILADADNLLPNINHAGGAAPSFAFASGEMPIDPHEPRYCYCDQVSWGEMIACDSGTCEKEWFHLNCVGLTEAPKGRTKWYCNDCKEKTRSGTYRKKGH